jgi:hypothetical protein
MTELKLFMVLIGCKPKGRLTEQHDVFFGIAEKLKDLVPAMYAFWPEAKGEMHIDCWREINRVNEYSIQIIPKNEKQANENSQHLFFINLGGYKPNEFEEYHYKIISVGKNTSEAVKSSKQTAFYKHFGFKGAESHVDDKYAIDADDVFKIENVLEASFKEKYALNLVKDDKLIEDELHIGYLQIKKLLAS